MWKVDDKLLRINISPKTRMKSLDPIRSKKKIIRKKEDEFRVIDSRQ